MKEAPLRAFSALKVPLKEYVLPTVSPVMVVYAYASSVLLSFMNLYVPEAELSSDSPESRQSGVSSRLPALLPA